MREAPLQINLYSILKSRISKDKFKFIPAFLIRWLERLICQNELNEILRSCFPSEGVDFAHSVLEYLNISVDVVGIENIPDDGRFIFASNHPLGGLDGIALIKVLGRHYGGDEKIRFLVNDMLMNVEPLRKVFLPINKYGAQGREAAQEINRVYESDIQMIIFPAGLVSRRHADGSIKDLQWQKGFVAKAVEYKRDIIPVKFEGLNRPSFYRFAYWRKRSGVKVNIEQALLPAELCKSRNKRFRVVIGEPIGWQDIENKGTIYLKVAQDIKDKVYRL